MARLSSSPPKLKTRASSATSKNCAGCHQLTNDAELGGGLFWPASLGIVHVSEVNPEAGEDGPRYRISPLLVSSFLPTFTRDVRLLEAAHVAAARLVGLVDGRSLTH